MLWVTLGLMLNQVPKAAAAAVFLGPSPYLSFADSPFSSTYEFGFFYVETFENGGLNTPGATASSGWVVVAPGIYTDSVDADDGVVDGSGTNGHSFYSNLSTSNLTVTFSAAALGGNLPTHAGIVCTDVGQVTSGTPGFGTVTFAARDADGVPLGSITQTNFGNGAAFGSGAGAVAEDRFFGVINSIGISSIAMSVANSVDWEVDHLQYGWFRPRLRIQSVSPGITLIAWSTNAAGFVLQQNTNLTSTNWIAVTNLPVTVGSENQVTVSSLSGITCYRLIDPD